MFLPSAGTQHGISQAFQERGATLWAFTIIDDPKKAKTLAATPLQIPPYIPHFQTVDLLMLQTSVACRF